MQALANTSQHMAQWGFGGTVASAWRSMHVSRNILDVNFHLTIEPYPESHILENNEYIYDKI